MTDTHCVLRSLYCTNSQRQTFHCKELVPTIVKLLKYLQARPGGFTRKTPGGEGARRAIQHATEVGASAGAHVERPNLNIGRNILCRYKV